MRDNGTNTVTNWNYVTLSLIIFATIMALVLYMPGLREIDMNILKTIRKFLSQFPSYIPVFFSNYGGIGNFWWPQITAVSVLVSHRKYLKAFLLCGTISLIGQIILDNTKLTPGHITSMFVVIGAILSFLGIYEVLRDYSLVGSSIPITSFGNALYQAALEGYNKNGFIGIFSNILTTTSSGISSAIFFGFIFSMIGKTRD